MDPVSLALIIKGLATLGLILGGVMALRYGFRLYMDGTGTRQDSYTLEISGLKLKANSVGSVLMATAFAWAWAAVAMSPSLSQNGQSVQVYSFHTPEGDISSRVLTTRASASAASDPEELKALFRRAVTASEAHGNGSVVSVHGEPASIDLASLKTTGASMGDFQLSALAQSQGQTTELLYQSRAAKGKVVFVPAKAEMASGQ
jgi:hypothetical protein